MNLEQSLLGRLTVGATLCFGLTFTADVFAQEPSCKADVARFCSQIQPGGGRIARCLRQSEGQLSAPCRERIKMVAVQLKETNQACQDEVQQHCTGVELGGGRIAQCLKRNLDKLSPECRTLANLVQSK